jgi:hypothetical protein
VAVLGPAGPVERRRWGHGVIILAVVFVIGMVMVVMAFVENRRS